ncbi:MAG: UvrD-helicase domain-containing protein [Planctomycetales bacterium]|nr:UvrD-helicase domain-containing protein [Planctomycetales bacterium]
MENGEQQNENGVRGRPTTKREPTGLTHQQHAAIHTRDVSVGLSAGAGCGKTFVLTQRFLAHLEHDAAGPAASLSTSNSVPSTEYSVLSTQYSALSTQHSPLSRLVAITFTERAAREMRDRIRAECRHRLQQCPDEQVAHWQQLVREIDGARISTIHAFCAGLLRSHAVEAGLDPRFGLLDPATTTSFLRKTVGESVRSLLAERNPDAMELVLEFGLEGTEEIARKLVVDRFRIDFAAWDGMTPSVLVQQWLDRWRTRTVPELLRRLWDSDEARCVVRLLAAHESTHDVMRERRAIVLELLTNPPDVADPVATLESLREGTMVKGAGTAKHWSDPDVYEQVKQALQGLRKEIDAVLGQASITPEDATTAATVGLMTLHVAKHAVERYTREKQRAGLLDFDDLLLLTRDLLRDHPSVRNRVSSGIALLMVDEFQDTDPVQAEIVRHLCGGDVSHGKLFFVGDAKQSIYRFRRADPAVFDALRGELDERGRLPLSRNFRSQPVVLQFVNSLFDGVIGDAYEPLVPHHEQLATDEPSIEFLFAETDALPAPITSRENPSPQGGEGSPRESADDLRRREAEWIAARVREILTDGVPRVREKDPATGAARLRMAQPGDIVILFRALTNVQFYEAALRDAGLAYYLVGGRAFFAQQEIFDLINLCRFLLDRDDSVSLAGILRSPFFGLSDDSLLTIAEQCSGKIAPHPPAPSPPSGGRGRTCASLRDALDGVPPDDLPEEQRDRIAHAARVLAELEGERGRMPVAGLLNLALDRTGYDASLLLEFLGPRKLANLRKLVEMARELDHSGMFGLSEFVGRLEDAMADEAKEELAAIHPEASNVVRLMSIHQSKGLEFPIVIVADMDRKDDAGNTSRVRFDSELGPLVNVPEKFGRKPENIGRRMFEIAERDADEAEFVRLLYVATTRAADHLILSAGLKDIDKVSSVWMTLLASRFDLRTGLPKADAMTGEFVSPGRSLGDVPGIRVHVSRPMVSLGTIAPRPQPPYPEEGEGSGRARGGVGSFCDAVARAEPIPLPRLLEKLRPDAAASRTFSVSVLDQVDDGECDLAALDWELVALDPSHSEIVTDVKSEVDHKQLGTLVHAVLERIDFASPRISIDACWDHGTAELSTVMRDSAELMVRGFLRSPLAVELARSRRCFRELDFGLRWPKSSGSGPTHLISGTIDCAYQTDQGTWAILDYKSIMLRSPTDAETRLREYSFQLGVYCLALEQWLGVMPERADLVLLRGGVHRIGFRPTRAFLDETARRVDAAIGHRIDGPVGIVVT